MKLFLTIGVTVLLASMPAAAETLLIAPFEDSTGKSEFAARTKNFPDLVTACLAGADAVQVVEREKLDLIMKEEGLHWENLTDQTAATRTASLLQARYLLRGSFTIDLRRPRAHAFLYEITTGRLIRSWDATPQKALSGQACEVAGDVAAALQSKLPPKPELAPEPDPVLSALLITGLGHYYTNHAEEAISDFLKATDRNPKSADARYWLARSYTLAKMHADARIECDTFIKQFPGHPKRAEMNACWPERK